MDPNGQIALIIFFLLLVLGGTAVLAYRKVRDVVRNKEATRKPQQPTESGASV